MKTLLSAIIFISAFNASARSLYPEEFVKLPSSSYKLIITKNIKMTDKRSKIIFHNGEIVKSIPKEKNVFFCELTNARPDGTKISLEKDNVFRFDNEDGFYWKHFVTGRIWRQRMFFRDNDDVQYFNCNDTASYQNNVTSDGVTYANIKKAVGDYLKIILE